MPRNYEASPLIEALFEVLFEPNTGWDLTIPGLLYEHIKTEYPDKEQKQVFNVEMQNTKGVSNAPRAVTPIAKMIFRTKDKTGLLQVSPPSFAINQLPPYGGWATFREVIQRNVATYQKVAPNRKPTGVSLRYINRVKTDLQSFSLEEYFSILPQVPATAENPVLSFFMSTTLGSQTPRGSLTIILTDENPKSGSSFIFDFQFSSEGADCPEPDKLPQWLDEAHQKISQAFDGAFTEKAHKNLFKEKTL
jgi:uncharacterized protein (TIGR04255 family)